jgi:16S rRNA G1207 methylase RsmC
MSYPSTLEQYNPKRIVTNDIRPDSPAEFHEDFISYPIKSPYDMVITNPPFNLALPIIEKALDTVTH